MRLLVLLLVLPLAGCRVPPGGAADRIRPLPENPRYWQYEGRPVLLVGGSREDNLFQLPGLEAHLDLLARSGGNYVRNTMSSRDSGNVWPSYRLPDGRYDLGRLSDPYFERFEALLRLAARRDVVVQIELWDRFDFAREPWLENPFRPANNVNYTPETSGLADEYPRHPGSNDNPFFRPLARPVREPLAARGFRDPRRRAGPAPRAGRRALGCRRELRAVRRARLRPRASEAPVDNSSGEP